MRRFIRLTNAFSKKLDNHRHSIALYFMYYNFCRVHQTLRVTPTMEAGFRIMFGASRKLFLFWEPRKFVLLDPLPQIQIG